MFECLRVLVVCYTSLNFKSGSGTTTKTIKTTKTASLYKCRFNFKLLRLISSEYEAANHDSPRIIKIAVARLTVRFRGTYQADHTLVHPHKGMNLKKKNGKIFAQ